MFSLNVYIEIDGDMTKVGTLSGTDCVDARFEYDGDYLSDRSARPISISLPLQEMPFSAYATKTYFEALLPEGFSRRAVAGWAKASEDDYIALLRALGRECIGAVQISDGERENDGGYKEISDEELLSLANEGATKSTELLVESHISLAGASGKVGLYYDEENNKWYQPFGTAASTHIVKQSHVRLENLVLNEQLCMRAAAKLGIDVPDSFILNIGNKRDEDILYAVERFDRMPRQSGKKMSAPYRLHQEDFAQALGIPASEKYETQDRHYLKKMFELINNYSSSPLEDGLKLWDRIVFNYLIGNMDAHVKNYGLLYSRDLHEVKLSPAYDMVCTKIYGNRNELSVMINGKSDCTVLTRKDFLAAAGEAAIGPKIAMQHFDYLSENIERAVRKAADELTVFGYEKADDLKDRIIKSLCILA